MEGPAGGGGGGGGGRGGGGGGGGEIFRTRPDWSGAHPASYKMGTGSVPEVKRPGRGVDHPPPSSAEVEDRLELYLLLPSPPGLLRGLL